MKDHLHLLACQFLARALQPGHVSFPYVQMDQGPRRLRETLRSKCLADVQPYLEADGTLAPGNYQRVKDSLHTDIVARAIQNSAPNRVLGVRPPPVDASETSLPRLSRMTLSQLRSGFCGRMKDYQKRIGKSVDDVCPDCGLFAQTVQHLFECPAHPTTLDVMTLWERPRDAVDHLRSFTAFNELPPLGTPPRPARRRRPPAAPPDSPEFSPLVLPASPFFSQGLTPPPTPPSPIRPLMPQRNLTSWTSSSSLHSGVNSLDLFDL